MGFFCKVYKRYGHINIYSWNSAVKLLWQPGSAWVVFWITNLSLDFLYFFQKHLIKYLTDRAHLCTHTGRYTVNFAKTLIQSSVFLSACDTESHPQKWKSQLQKRNSFLLLSYVFGKSHWIKRQFVVIILRLVSLDYITTVYDSFVIDAAQQFLHILLIKNNNISPTDQQIKARKNKDLHAFSDY